MATIDSLGPDAYMRYAYTTDALEIRRRELKTEYEPTIRMDVEVLSFYPRIDNIDILLGLPRTRPSGAVYQSPDTFNLQRKSPFTFSRLAPWVFDYGDSEEALKELIQDIPCYNKEEEAERDSLLKLLGTLNEINSQLGYVANHVAQFLPG